MNLCIMNEILKMAQSGGYAAGAFEFWSLDSAQAIVAAANEKGKPVILQAGPLECRYAGVENIAQLARMASKDAIIPVALHLDHGDTVTLVEEALAAGFTSVMIDASHLPFEENIAVTQQVVKLAAKKGASVESELGRLMGSEAGMRTQERDAYETDPGQAEEFVSRTGIDALAVAIGSAHGFYTKEPNLNIRRLAEIRSRVEIPLVLHGGTGIPAGQITQSIEGGIAKINICTEFLAAVGRRFIEIQGGQGFKYSVPALFGPPMESGKRLVGEKIGLFANGR